MSDKFQIVSIITAIPILLMSLPEDVAAGELVARVSSNNYRSYSSSMTAAQQRSGDPISGGSNNPSLIESSYHGSNYFSYAIAVKEYKRALKDYERFGSYSYSRASGGGLQSVGTPQLALDVPNSPPVQRVVYVTRQERSEQRMVPSQRQVASIEMRPNRTEELKVQEVAKPAKLSLLSDSERTVPPAEVSESRNSMWTHFKRALVGN